MRADQIALQLYTVREASKRDFLATLRDVAALGYTAVEPAGLYDVPAERVREALDAHGMRAVAAHIPLRELDERPDGILADLRALGCDRPVVPWVAEDRRSSTAAVRALAADLNGWGRRLRDEGMSLAYHHHDFEFRPLEGSSMWEILTAELDPALVGLELDVYWAARGGQDPAALIARHAPAVSLIHLKDIAPGGTADVPAGEGALDWDAILAAARAAGAAWYIVEQDNPRDPLDDVRRAREQMLRRALP